MDRLERVFRFLELFQAAYVLFSAVGPTRTLGMSLELWLDVLSCSTMGMYLLLESVGIGDALGRSIRNFKKASNVEGEEDDKIDDKAGKKKELASAKASKQLDEGDGDEGEWEEVVVRRRKKPASATGE